MNLPSHEKVRSTHSRNEWMAALNSRFRPRFGSLLAVRVFGDIRDEPRVEDRFTVTPGIKPAIEIEIRAVDFQTGQSRHAFQRVQPLWQKYGIGFVDGCDRKWREHEAVVVHDRDDLLTRLMFVAGIADAISSLLVTVLVPTLCKIVRLVMVLLREMPHAGDERLVERAIVSPFREHLIYRVVGSARSHRSLLGTGMHFQSSDLHRGPDENGLKTRW